LDVSRANFENLTLVGSFATGGTGSGLANRITGSDFGNTLIGAGGSDALLGNGGENYLRGGDGADRLTGGFAADVLTGGRDADTFVFLAALESGPEASPSIRPSSSGSRGPVLSESSTRARARSSLATPTATPGSSSRSRSRTAACSPLCTGRRISFSDRDPRLLPPSGSGRSGLGAFGA
jgi:hypothetical protein